LLWMLQKKRELRELLREKYPDMTKIHTLIDELASIWAEIQKKMIDSYLHLNIGGTGEKIVPFPLLNKCYNRDS